MVLRFRASLAASCLFFPLTLAASYVAWAADECPAWAQERLKALQQRGIDAALTVQQTGNIDQYMTTLQQIGAEASKLPPGCVQQQVGGAGGGPNAYQCRGLWDAFKRCEADWKYKTAAGLNPPYTCIKPTCSY